MKFKLNENLPDELGELIRSRGHDVHTVADEPLVGRADADIFAATVGEQRILLTQDLDFSDIRQYRPGSHPGIVLNRLHHPSRRQLIARMEQVFAAESLESWDRCFVVVTDHKLRVRRP